MARLNRNWLLWCLALGACGEPNAPIRRAAYEFRGPDPLGALVSFHWPAQELPVQYFASAPVGAAQQYLEAALHVWEGQFLYGEFRGVMVTDSSSADVIMIMGFGGTPPNVPLTDDPPDIQACSGQTNFDDVDGNRVIDGQMVIILRLLAHSSNPDDLMATAPTAREPSASDRVTAQVLYHTRPDLRPAERAP
jgi:hypothetical protein